MFKNKTFPGKTPKTNFVTFGMAVSFISEIYASLKLSGNRERHVVNFVCSHVSQEYPRKFLDRKPIRAPTEKHYALVAYMPMSISQR